MDGQFLERVKLQILMASDAECSSRLCPLPPGALFEEFDDFSPEVWAKCREAHLVKFFAIRNYLREVRSLSDPLDMAILYSLPVNPYRLVRQFAETTKSAQAGMMRRTTKEVCSPTQCQKVIFAALDEISGVAGGGGNSYRQGQTMVTQAAILAEVSPHILIGVHRFSEQEVVILLQDFTRRFFRSQVSSGEAVGGLAAESLGEVGFDLLDMVNDY